MRRLAVVVVDHHQLLEADLFIELFDESVNLIVALHLNASAPEVGGVEAVGKARHIDAAGGHGFVDVDQLVEALADSIATAGAVLEHQECRVVGERHAVQDALHRFGDAGDAGLNARSHV